MKLLLNHASKSSVESIPIAATRSLLPRTRIGSSQQVLKPWICQQCRQRVSVRLPNRDYIGSYEQKVLSSGRQVGLLKSALRRISTESQKKSAQNDSYTSQKPPRKELPSQEEGRRSQVSRRFTHLMDHLQSNIFIAGQRLNDLTGYSGIEALKRDIEEQENHVQITRSSLQKAKEAYSTAISQRSASQREVNELLQRKHAWSGSDLERFTSLYRSDHTNEQSESAAQEALITAEREAEEAAGRLSASILARYHEEQIWSDKIRRMSTWGTWGLMGVNVLLFLVFQIGVEPWRRKRLVKGFEEKVVDALEREGAAMNAATGAALVALQANQGNLAVDNARTEPSNSVMVTPEVTDAVEEVAQTNSDLEVETKPFEISDKSRGTTVYETALRIFSSSRKTVEDLFSERQVLLRRVDLTAARIEGTLCGIALVSIVAALVRGR